jgi:hypothetical protein
VPAAPASVPAEDPAAAASPAKPTPKGIGDTLFRVDEPAPVPPSSMSSIEPGTLTLAMTFTSKPGMPAKPIRGKTFIHEGGAVAFVAPQQANATGPVLLRNLDTRADSRITVSAQSSTGSAQQIVLRGARFNGCALLTMSDASPCNSDKDESVFQLWFYDADNPGVPIGTYHGQLTIQAQLYPARTVVEVDTINYTIAIERGATTPALDHKPEPRSTNKR